MREHIEFRPKPSAKFNKYLSIVLFQFSIYIYSDGQPHSTPLLQARKLPLKYLRITCTVSLLVESMHSTSNAILE